MHVVIGGPQFRDRPAPELNVQSLRALLDHLPLGVIEVEADGHLRFANSTASVLLSRSDGLTCNWGDQLTAEAPLDARKLRGMIADAANHQSCGALLVHRSSRRRPLMVSIGPLLAATDNTSARAVLLVNDPETPSSPLVPLVQQMFGLSEGEAELTVALTEGKRIKQIANERMVKASTAQTQLKRALEKTGVRGQTALASLVRQVPYVQRIVAAGRDCGKVLSCE